MAAQFVKMVKDGIEQLVTPEKVQAMKAGGWKMVAVITVADEPVKKAPKKAK